MITSFNPATGQTLAQFNRHTPDQIETRLQEAPLAQQKWAHIPMADRMAMLRSVAATLRRDKDQLALKITLELGKPLAESIGEVENVHGISISMPMRPRVFCRSKSLSVQQPTAEWTVTRWA
jgi:acyl-CoA reductase-like NAD-dependent aldehyde dehydrogenase